MMDLEKLKEGFDGLEFIHGKELIRDISEGINHTGKSSFVQV